MTKHFDEFIKNSNVFFKVMEVSNMREILALIYQVASIKNDWFKQAVNNVLIINF